MARLRELGVDFEHWCFACGRLNPTGLQLDFEVTANGATARYTGLQRHQGYDGTLHGGRFQSRPVHRLPFGSTARWNAMSLHPCWSVCSQ